MRHTGTPVCGRCKQRLETSGAPQSVQAAAFRAALDASPVPILVDFWAPWCGPCRLAAPVLDQIAGQNAGKVTVLKVNTDETPELSSEFRIQGIPAFVLFKNGLEAARQEGLLPSMQFSNWLARHVASY